MIQIEYLPIVLTSVGIMASILYYASVLRNADQTRRTQLYMNIKRQLDDPNWWLRLNNVQNLYEWNDYEDFQEKYGPQNNPKAWSEVVSLMSFLNGIGVLVALDRIDIELLGMLLGNMPVDVWNKLESNLLEYRKVIGNPYAWGYFEYLKDEQKKRERRYRGKASYLNINTGT